VEVSTAAEAFEVVASVVVVEAPEVAAVVVEAAVVAGECCES
jgi:hypothetical protein